MNKFALLPAVLLIASATASAGSIHAKDVKVGYWGTQERANGHFQGEMTDFKAEVRPQLTDLYSQVADAKAHASRNTGLGEANQRRLNAKDELDQRQDDSINNAHARIGGVKEQADIDRVNSNQQDQAISQTVNYNEEVNKAYRQRSAEQFQQHSSSIAANKQAIASEADKRKQGDEELKAGVAMAVAAGSHSFDTSYRGMQLSLSGGFYEGASAQSLAAGGAITDNMFGSVSVSNDSRGNQAVGVNTTWKF